MASPLLPSGATTGDSGGELSSGDDPAAAEAPRGLAELFEQAAAHLPGLLRVASREQLLYLYARYKQVKVGNCNTPKPSFFDFEGKQKWEAWKALGDSSPSQAMQEYIAVVKQLDPGWHPQAELERETKRKVFLFHWITPQMAAAAGVLWWVHSVDLKPGARCFLLVSHAGAGGQALGPSSTAFPGHSQGLDWKKSNQDRTSAPTGTSTQGAGAAGGGLAK